MNKTELIVNVISYAKEHGYKIEVSGREEDTVSRIVIDDKQKLVMLS